MGLSRVPYWHPRFDDSIDTFNNTESHCNDSGVVGCWRLDGNGKDGSIYSNNFVIVGAKNGTGKVNTSYRFDGIDDYAYIVTNTKFKPVHTRSMSVWVNTNETNTNYIYRSPGATGTDFGLVQCAGNKFGYVAQTAAGYNSGGYNISLDNDKWYHIYYTYNNVTGSTFYINGTNMDEYRSAVNTAAGSCLSNLNNTGDILYTAIADYLGYFSSTRYGGYIDNLIIYNRSLSESEIITLYYDQKHTIQEDFNYRTFVKIRNTDTVNASKLEIRFLLDWQDKLIRKGINTSLFTIDPNSIRIYEVNQYGDCVNSSYYGSRNNCDQIQYAVDR